MWRTTSLRVAVVGAGIGGLAVAAGLQRAGAEVIVLEQAARFVPSGSALTLFGNGFTALGALGLRDRVEAIVADEPPDIPSVLRRRDGQPLATLGRTVLQGLRVIDRTALHSALLEALAPDTVRPGIRVELIGRNGIDLGPGGILSDAHVVVGADGIRSRVRGSHAGDPGPQYCGYGAWRATTDEPLPLRDFGETFGRGERFGYSPLPDGRVYWFAVRPSRTDDAPVRGELRERYGRWHDPVPELLSATSDDSIGYQPIERLARPLRTYSHGIATLVGDAAHAMPPTLGQGANLALEDAATLVALLTPMAVDPDPAQVPSRLSAYDRARRPRTQRIARTAHLLGSAGQWPNPLTVRARDRALRLAPATLFDRALESIVQWRPPS